MAHALVIGGTGMLSETSLWLVSKGYHVSVIGRNPNRMEKLIEKSLDKSLFTPVLVDYSDDNLLKKKLRYINEQNGEINLIIAWIHSYAKSALDIILREISNCNKVEWRLFHVLGSRMNLSDIKGELNIPPLCRYCQVQLGFIIEGENSRWLTNKEISQGVIESIKNDTLINIVGNIEPWEKRPLA